MTIQDAERKLKIRIKNIRNVSVAGMISEATTTLGDARIDKKTIDDLKEEVYYHILQYLNIEGYPTEASADYKEANVSDLVLYVIGPIIARMNEVGRKTRLSRERAIFAEDSSIGGIEEFVVVDEVAVTEEKSVLIIEAKRHAIGHAMIQILLAMKDAQENNLGGIVYGFVTTGEDWRMLTYDGGEFVMTNKIVVLFNTMKEEKEKWLQENAIIVDCMLIALTNGGIMTNPVE
ncbi:hypothetical protein B9Z19DRAFT_272754 [Tuber borchii]|uniref:Uncharacterized protein n=1 Tax=Tuber borchii TaxID=42251 RepID=A0A2T6ZL00_TUBBO|nr:hypothetical protein B9Z19DRAFT_272754 [Tuber borchii]